MFEESLIESAESNALIAHRNRWPAMISIGLQGALAVALLSLPLLRPESLSLHSPQLTLVGPLPKPPAQPTPPQRVRLSQISAQALAGPSLPTPALSQRSSWSRLLPASTTDVPPSADGPVQMNFGTNSPLALNLPSDRSGPAVYVVSTSGSHSGKPLQISSGVSTGLLLEPIRPTYPQIVKVTRTQGTVVVQALISTQGKVENAHVLSGPAMLQEAALEAVRSALYRPYLLNHQAIEVETTFSINFRISK